MKSLLISLALIAASSNADTRPETCPLDLPVVVNPAQCFDAPMSMPRLAPASELPKFAMNVELLG